MGGFINVTRILVSNRAGTCRSSFGSGEEKFDTLSYTVKIMIDISLYIYLTYI